MAELEAGGKVNMNIAGEDIEVINDYIDIRITAKDGFAVAMESNVFTILDTMLTPELVKEGLA